MYGNGHIKRRNITFVRICMVMITLNDVTSRVRICMVMVTLNDVTSRLFVYVW